jgi:hypothetical protein
LPVRVGPGGPPAGLPVAVSLREVHHRHHQEPEVDGRRTDVPFDDEKATKLYGSYEPADGRLKPALVTRRPTRPLKFKSGDDVLLFHLKVSKATPAEVQSVVEQVVREPVAKPKNAPAPMPKAIDEPGPGPNKP